MTKIKIAIKHFLTGSILFEYESENNTVLQTVKEAVRLKTDLTGADLRGADLIGADLRGAYLTGAYLRGADLRGAYLRGADLRGAYLTGAYLRGADLRGAYLTGAYLTGAYLRGADLRGADLTGNEKIQKAAVFTGLYTYAVIPYITEEGEKRVKMGCHNRSLAEWETNFWNNNNEFPNDGSEKSQMRVMAFETAKAWFNIFSPENK